MRAIDTSSMTDADLQSYDRMMIECVPKVAHFSPLAVSIWADVLEELQKRGQAKVTSGSLDDLGNALILRTY